MSKSYQHDPQLLTDVAKKTAKIEAAYKEKQAQKRQKRSEKEELEQRFVAPLLLLIVLFIGWMLTLIF